MKSPRTTPFKFAMVGTLLCTGLAAFTQPATASSSSFATGDAGGRHVEVKSDDGSASVHASAGKIEVTTASTKITIDSQRVLFKGEELAKLDGKATKFRIDIAGGQLTVKADGATVATKQLAK